MNTVTDDLQEIASRSSAAALAKLAAQIEQDIADTRQALARADTLAAGLGERRHGSLTANLARANKARPGKRVLR